MTTARRGAISAGLDIATITSEAVYRGPIVLATIELPAYGANPAKTLKLATREYVDPSGVPWEPVLHEPPSIDHGGDWMETGWQPVDLDLVVHDKRITTQGVSESFLTLLKLYEFTGARVHVQQAFDNLTSVNDFRTLLDGEIAEVLRVNPASVQFHCIQSRKWIRPVPVRKLTPTDYPNAPRDLFGVPLPVVYGDFYTNRMFTALGAAGDVLLNWFGCTRGVFPTVCVEAENSAAALPAYLISDDPMHTDPRILYLYESPLNRYAHSWTVMDSVSTDPVVNRLDDGVPRHFEIAILPTEKHADNNYNFIEKLFREDRPFTDTIELSVAASYTIRVNLPDVSPLGDFIGARFNLAYTYSGGAPPTVTVGVKNSAVPSQETQTITTTTTGAVLAFDLTSTTVPNASWEDIKNLSLYLSVTLTGVETFRIYGMAVTVRYIPSARIVRPGTTREVTFDTPGRTPFLRSDEGPLFQRIGFQLTSPDIATFETRGYAGGKGYKDDGSGTYTGTANALIEHPADIAHHALRTFGGVASSEVTTAAGDFGSFSTLRTTLSGYKMLIHTAQETDAEGFVRAVGNEALIWFHRRATLPGSPWVAIPWDTGAVDYRSTSSIYTFSNDASDFEERSFQVSRTRISQQVNNVRVNFDWDPRSGGYAAQVYITDTASRVYSGGYTTDAGRVTSALASVGRYGRRELTLNLRYVSDPATASSILTRLFDLRVEPRVVIDFRTWMNAFDLERGHVIQLSSDWDTYMTYPKPGSNGSWSGKKFRVYRVQRAGDQPTRYRVTAVEV